MVISVYNALYFYISEKPTPFSSCKQLSTLFFTLFVIYAAYGLSGCTPNEEGTMTANSISTCTPGNQGCVCLDGGQCNMLAGEAMVCRDNQCVPPPVESDPNTPNMPNMPTTPNQSAISVNSEQARGCELLITDPDNLIQKVLFNSTVKGQWMRRDKRVAIAFFSQDDQGIQVGAVSLQSVGSLDMLQTTHVKCVDRFGSPIDEATLSIN